ncbi:GtrA family protein [Vibrio parahaemolyticus]|nr:GtrA family protein [Vibrio parahaemolyticus]
MFTRYALVGFVNTGVHFISFFFLIALGYVQSISNLVAFSIAVSCSYLLNAKFTFKAQYKLAEYAVYVLFMGFLSYLIGSFGDYLMLPSLISLITFSALSLVIGYRFSKFLFKKEK